MNELSGLALRKAACEVIGFHITEQPEGFRLNWPRGSFGPCRKSPEEAWRFDSATVAIESDPAVSEPMFLEWCAKNGFSWEMWSAFDGTAVVFCLLIHGSRRVKGAIPSEARARAIVEAGRKEKA